MVHIKSQERAASSSEMQSTQDGLKQEEQARTKPTDPEQQVRRSTRQRRIPNRYSDCRKSEGMLYRHERLYTPVPTPVGVDNDNTSGTGSISDSLSLKC
jgi:hypothetical protein